MAEEKEKAVFVALSVPVIGLLSFVVLLAGALNGVSGFGFALVGTMVLATMIDPAMAVVFMILPILSVNLSLVRDLSAPELQTCGERFGPLILAALAGTVVGMVALQRVPEGPLRVGLGLITLAFVVSAQDVIQLPGLSRVREGCFVETPLAMVGVGGISGVLFGGTNVGVQLIAYLRSCDLSHGLFVGVVAIVFLGLNGIRVAAASVLGLYPNSAFVLASLVATIPAVTGVAIGKRFRGQIGERDRRLTVLGLLTVIGLQLVWSGTGL